MMKYEEVTEKIIGVYYEVYRTLGSGFLEKVYEGEMALEFKRRGIEFERQVCVDVLYKGDVAGKYIADFIIEEKVIVEIKAKGNLNGIDDAQLLNYLKGTGREVGLLFNFGGKKSEFKRKVFG
jgi:GxxExxY protein